jgi:tRNA modification GTPase
LIPQTALNEDAFDTENSVVPNLRHKLVFDKSLDSVLSAVEGIRGKISFEMIAVDIQDALELLGGVTGVDVEEDMVDRIFGKFCIGK